MLSKADLDEAVTDGIVTMAQAEALLEISARRETLRAGVLGHEERFRFMRGFNDFFFAIGIVLLGFGLMYFATFVNATGGMLIAAAIIWGLAELLVRRMRLVLPGILIVLFFAAFVMAALRFDPGLSNVDVRTWWGKLFPTGTPTVIALDALIGSGAAALFYARFRLPFALLPVAAGFVVAVQALAYYLPVGDVAQVRSLVLLVCGLGVFAAAMAFDLSDRERTTRRADCAFWLHLLAAPLIVHSLISMTGSLINMSASDATAIAIIVVLLTLVAVVIDRRALLVSALGYLGSAIGYALARATADRGFVFFATLLILGTAVITLGVAWLPLRRRLLAVLPVPGLAGRLPPVVVE